MAHLASGSEVVLPPVIHVDQLTARRFVRRALLLDEPVASVAAALAYHGFIQIDPINVCGRMHDLILRNRVADYREGDLLRHIHQPSRPGFEHYLPDAGILCAFPIDAWPYLVRSMQERSVTPGRYSGQLSVAEKRLARRILDEIGDRGPLMSDEIKHSGSALTAWGTTGREVKTVLEKLFFHGRVLISQRRNFRRVYDLPERVLPPDVLASPAPDSETNQRWLALCRLRQRRLARLGRTELPLLQELVQPVKVDGGSILYVLRQDADLLERVRGSECVPAAPGSPLLLAPLEPLIYDRRITSELWNFNYTWEVYTPPEKRSRGYYALPVLVDTELVGHVDLKADRVAGRLRIVSRRVRQRTAISSAVSELARFIGLRA